MGKKSIEEKARRLEEVKEKLNEIGFTGIKAPFGEEFKGVESLYELMLWNLTPMEAIAAMIQSEIHDLNYNAIDILANDLKVRLEDLREIIETWMDGELQGGLKKNLGENTMHIHRFVYDQCVLGDDEYQVEPKELYKEYRGWVEKKGNIPLSRGEFYKQVLLSFPLIREKYTEDDAKEVYVGIGI